MAQPQQCISILIVDDHSVVRQGIRAFCETQEDLIVVGEAESGEQAILLAQKHQPDVVLMDLLMVGMNGVEATRCIKGVSPHSHIIILTSYYEDENIFPALRAGALSYTLKDIHPTELIDAIRKAARGESVLHTRVASRIVQEVHASKAAIPAAFAELTEREIDVLRLIAQGESNASIATQLVLSEKTVKGHVSNILSKLHLTDRTQAAAFAWQHGLMNVEK
jgi:two-component system, NarL family, response regulator LiaR